MSKQTDLINIPDAITVSGSNVGIGTASPVSLSNQTSLTINGTSVGRLDLQGTGQLYANSTEIVLQGSYGKPVAIDAGTNQHISFRYATSEKMRIDGSGRVTTPSQPAFLAHGNSGAYYSISTLGGGSYISFANAVTNIGNCFNPSNSRFSAPVAGMYHFDVAVYTRTGSASEDIYPRWRVNNSSNKGYIYWWNTTGAEIHHTITDSINIYLNAGDDIGVTINGNANSDIHLGFQESRFSGYLLG
jgi:hypothetical protein